MKPTTMLYRNLMAMDVEESIRSYPLDGVVLLTGCDKTNPASILGAASADIPSIVVTGGPMLNGRWRGREIGSCSDCWHYHEELRAGRITEKRVGRDRELDVPLEWALHDHGNGVDDGVRHGGARPRRSPAERPSPPSTRDDITSRKLPDARSCELVGRGACVRLTSSRAKHSRTRSACSTPSRGSTNAILHLLAYRGPCRRRPPVAALRRAVRVDPLARRPQAGRALPHGGLLLRRRSAGRHGDRSPSCSTSTRSRSPGGRSARTSPVRRSSMPR